MICQDQATHTMELTKEDLAWALCSIMDGMKEHEIHEITGLPQDDCKKVWAVYRQALSEPFAARAVLALPVPAPSSEENLDD